MLFRTREDRRSDYRAGTAGSAPPRRCLRTVALTGSALLLGASSAMGLAACSSPGGEGGAAGTGPSPRDVSASPSKDVSEPKGWKPWQTSFEDGNRDSSPSEDEENGCSAVDSDTSLLRCMGTGFRAEELNVSDGAHEPGRKPGAYQDFAHRDGTVYTRSDYGKGNAKTHVRALDEKTRKERWKQSTGTDAVLTRDGIVGTEQTGLHWPSSVDMDNEEELGESPPRSDPGGDIISWDAKTGEERWRIGAPDDKWCAPLAAGGRTFVSCTERENEEKPVTLYRVDGGAEKLHRLAEVDVPPRTTGVGEKFLGYDRGSLIFLPNDSKDLYDPDFNRVIHIDARTGGKREVRLPAGIPDSDVDLKAGDIYFRQDGGRKLISVDAATGEQRWEEKGPFEQLSAPAVSAKRGEVYFSGHDGRLVALDRATGDERWRSEESRAEDGGTNTDELGAPSSVHLADDVLVVSTGNTVFSVTPENPDAKPGSRRKVSLGEER